MSERKKNRERSHRFFGLYVGIFFCLMLVVILVSSFNQEKAQNINRQLSKEKDYSAGIQQTVQDITDENEGLKKTNELLQQQITVLQSEKDAAIKERDDAQALLDDLCEAYRAGDDEKCGEIVKNAEEKQAPTEQE